MVDCGVLGVGTERVCQHGCEHPQVLDVLKSVDRLKLIRDTDAPGGTTPAPGSEQVIDL